MTDPLIGSLLRAVEASPQDVPLRLHLAALLLDAGRGGWRGRQRQYGATHAAVGSQAPPGVGEGGGQISLVECDERGDACGLASDEGAGELVFGKSRLGGQQDEGLVNIGGEGLGAHLVLPVQQVAARFDALDAAFVLRGLPQHAVARHGLAFLAARVADDALAVRRFHNAVAAVAGDDEAALQGGGAGRRTLAGLHETKCPPGRRASERFFAAGFITCGPFSFARGRIP